MIKLAPKRTIGQKLIKRLGRLVRSNYWLHTIIQSNSLYLEPIPVPTNYPTDINVEITTYCNAKCSFCTRETVTKSGVKPVKHMEFEQVKNVIDKVRELTRQQNVPEERIQFSPVGLGEPLLNPSFFDIVAYARQVFPKAHIHANSNCIVLKGKIAERLAGSEVDSIVLSLCFDDRETFNNLVGVEKYDTVVENIRNFLALRGERTPRVTIHVFDKDLTAQKYSEIVKRWNPLLRETDRLLIEKYMPLTDWSPKQGEKHPCSQLWNTMMVDIDGYVFPCCLGVWTKRDDGLCLGKITDDSQKLLKKLAYVRQRHISGDYGICNGCGYLTTWSGRNKKNYEAVKKLGL
ncbi:MAG: radical SAM protein [Candidatus Omnitrophica bacterium]|nr:radical SAM protein [Candidatus Omnitrophota bacterium]